MTIPDYAIEARGLVKTYPATKTTAEMQALKGIDLVIPRGSIFGLLGPNGAGKSTFINILAGLCKKTSGTVSIWGRDIDERPRDARAAIGVVPQEIAADPFFTPRESLEVQAGMYGVPPGERRTMELLNALGLGDKANAYVRQLSGGMKRRLMVAKAMTHNPPVLILDEPTAGVDVELRKQLWNYVLELNRKGVTIVLTTHYLEEAQELCDQIAIVNRGQVVACEPTSTLLARMDIRNVVVTPEEPVTSAPTLPGFDTKLRAAGAFAVSYRTGQSSVEQVLAAVRGAGLHIKDIATEDPDLEDVFVSLTSAPAPIDA
ncbi:MAG: ABC transporter ATP-binding protein [Phenylobacterium sp.]|uniref:ABC transporter ATP-binding protein n=1 Tax=Phenylobacterium sp. TaxID=1871053 RepID=UPI001B7B5834|nr:ABC transporter ATP-binding protein [Phenylobacterium sp.]MBP7651465.1 ABC transporter ATP-binding protein [Phenylobacterium sp.]MBP7817549.1 ABC transporter ATP-binding protein [Phenylobacterium sp.]MBP9232891.1 ABC transporter ATP-binding protein [Phenylobacterium sp.]MBP9756221.1 ABC transporter ATP-binding protein [Phenylobacterium sp.]